MEMTRGKAKSEASSESEHFLRQSSFDAEQERQDLQHILTVSAVEDNVVSYDNSDNIVATAVPISSENTFEYNSLPLATATTVKTTTQAVTTGTQTTPATSLGQPRNTKEEDEVKVSPLHTDANLSTAHALSSYSTPATYQQVDASLLRQAQHRGLVETEIDKTKDMFAKAQLKNTRKDTAAALQRAEINARKAKRSDEGLTVDESIHHNYVHSTINGRSEEEPTRQFGTTKDGKRGYEVAEYDVTDYDTSEYDVTNYKSLYD